jgi:disulfide bond formation protein DsbB
MTATRIALLMGAIALALVLGALGFQYLDNLPPCEMCHWQRWPHIAAAVVGLVGGMLLTIGVLPARTAPFVAAFAILGVAVAGALGVYHAGVEWHWWLGPQACTTGFVFNGHLDLTAPVPHCDIPAWTLFRISLAGYNAIFSLGAAALGTVLLVRRK